MIRPRILALCLFLTGTPMYVFSQETGTNTESDYLRELITEWNASLYEVAEEHDGFLSLKGVRTAAIMHGAMYDVLGQIRGDRAAHESINSAAAVSEAAYTVASSEYPDYIESFDRLRESNSMTRSPEHSLEQSLELGRKVARAHLEVRAADNWNAEVEYNWHPMAPGVYAEFSEHSGTPEGFVFGSGWAVAQPFTLPAPDYFRSPPPPALDSYEYYEAFEEVKSVGSYQSSRRTHDQTHLAVWWKDFAENSHNRLARSLVDKEALDSKETARLFALINVAIFDAYVSVFDNKFHYNHWRPYTAIREAATDGNEWTEPDSLWTNLHNHTYAFPSYPSAHGTACAAAMTIFADVFEDDYAFTMSNPVVDLAGPFSGKIRTDPPTRTFGSFSDAALECSLSRVYLGIHFRYDSIEGYNLGNRIGTYVLNNTPME